MWGDLAESEEIREKIVQFESMVPAEVATILDVGCGDGAITNHLDRRYDVTGVDTSPAALEHVTARSKLASATALPFESASFDLVLSSQVLEHLSEQDYRQALAEMSRVARRFVLVSVPYREQLAFRRVRCPACGWQQHVWGHVRSFTVDSLLSDLRGFEAREVRVFGSLQEPHWPTALLWPLQRGLRCFYDPAGQSPLCERCGNRDYSAARGLPDHAWRVKRALDRRGARASLPFWLAVLVERRDASE